MTTIPINLWSSPRNVSTAFMYAWANRKDCTVVDEPLYAHYLCNSEVIHPGQNEILDAQEKDGSKVVKNILLRSYSKPIAFFKQMSHHLVALDWSFLLEMKNIIFIREPERIINSYAKVRKTVTLDDIGVKKQAEIFDYLNKNKGTFVVLDSKELLSNPKSTLEKLCLKLEIPFADEMLSWKAGPRKEDGIWAKYWYENVHQSTGFQPYKERNVILSTEHSRLAKECQPYYEMVKAHAI